MAKTIQDKIQQLELDTVRAVTEMKVDIRNLTDEVKKLNETIVRMNENYVTKSQYVEDKAEFDDKIEQIKKKSFQDKILTAVVTTVIVGIVMYEVGRFFK